MPESVQKEAREYATKHTPQTPVAPGDPQDTKYADTFMKHVGDTTIRRQQRGMHETAATETANQSARDAYKSQRASREFGGPRTPTYK
jgi:LPS O-antigen subunit length determinant protein (WzzB/FepE family)